MDFNEIMSLLAIVEKAHAHGTQFQYIRDAAAARLQEINTELNPNPPAEVTADEPGEAEDNPATTREAVEEEEPADG